MNHIPSNHDLLKTINELEDHIKPSSMRINGYNIWPLIRISICFGLISERYQSKSFYQNKKQSIGIIKAFLNYLSYHSNNKNMSIGVLNVTHDVYQNTINGSVFDRVHYGNESKKINNNEVTRLNLADFSIRDVNNNKKRLDFFNLVRLIKMISIPCTIFIVIRNYKTFRSFFSIYKFLKAKNLNTLLILVKLPFKISYAFLLSTYVAKFFRRCNITALHHSNFYSLDSMALTLGARRCDIPVINIQHGVQAKNHPAFGRWKNIPPSGYKLLPSEFICWNQQSVNTLEKSFKFCENHKSTLSQYHWVNGWKNEKIPFDYKEIKSKALNKFNILVTLQPSINGIQDIIRDSINETSDEVRWWIRLHPRQQTDIAKKEIKDMIIDSYKKDVIDLASSTPLPALLSITDLHITGFSSSIYEASYFNIPTVLTHKMAKDYYGKDLEILKASICETKDGIIESIKNGINNKF